MFTGIIEELGTVKALRREAGAARLILSAAKVLDGTALGDSICVNGVCLTVVEMNRAEFSADVAVETLRVTNLGDLQAGKKSEPGARPSAFRADRRAPGDGTRGRRGTRPRETEEGNGWRIFIDAPASVLRYVIKKGSIAIDGISLTVADVDNAGFAIAMIPHTAKLTTLGFKTAGDSVNLESDIIGKYVERLLAGRREGA